MGSLLCNYNEIKKDTQKIVEILAEWCYHINEDMKVSIIATKIPFKEV